MPVFGNVFYEITALLVVASSVLVRDELRKPLARLGN